MVNEGQSETLRARQARVGIIANPALVQLPVHLPRDIWTRWPDLRSRRRLKKTGTLPPQDAGLKDPVLDGVLLDDLMSEFRKRRPQAGNSGRAGPGRVPEGPDQGWVSRALRSGTAGLMRAMSGLTQSILPMLKARLRRR